MIKTRFSPKQRMLVNHQHGFTLIEAMIAVALIAIAVTIAIPSYSQLTAANRLAGDANSFVAAFQFAKSEAVRQNRHIILCHSNDQANCSSPSGNNWRGWIVVPLPVVPGAEPLRAGTFSPRLNNSASAMLAGTNHQIRFTPTGLVRSPINAFTMLNATLAFCDAKQGIKNNIRLVRFSSGGRIHVESAENSGSCPQPSNG